MYQTYVFVQLHPAPLELKTAFFFPCLSVFFHVFFRRRSIQRSCRVSHGAAVESAQQPVQSQTQLHHFIHRFLSELLLFFSFAITMFIE